MLLCTLTNKLFGKLERLLFMIKQILKFFILLSIVPVAYSDNQLEEVPQFTYFHDVNKFDIAGVRLGMNAKEAEQKIRAKLQLDSSQIEYDSYPKVNIVTKTKEPRYFIVKKGDIEISVNFTPAVPADLENPMLVSSVTYKMPRTPQNMLSMQKLALKKYGKPSNGVRKTDREFSTYKWCYVVEEKRNWGCAHSSGAKLVLSPPTLTMSDISYHNAVNEYINKLKSSNAEF